MDCPGGGGQKERCITLVWIPIMVRGKTSTGRPYSKRTREKSEVFTVSSGSRLVIYDPDGNIVTTFTNSTACDATIETVTYKCTQRYVSNCKEAKVVSWYSTDWYVLPTDCFPPSNSSQDSGERETEDASSPIDTGPSPGAVQEGVYDSGSGSSSDSEPPGAGEKKNVVTDTLVVFVYPDPDQGANDIFESALKYSTAAIMAGAGMYDQQMFDTWGKGKKAIVIYVPKVEDVPLIDPKVVGQWGVVSTSMHLVGGSGVASSYVNTVRYEANELVIDEDRINAVGGHLVTEQSQPSSPPPEVPLPVPAQGGGASLPPQISL